MNAALPTRLASGTRIVGVDPGLNITGYGAIEVRSGKAALLEAGVLRPGVSGQVGLLGQTTG